MGASLGFTGNKQPIEANQENKLQKKLLLIESDQYLSQVFLVNENHSQYQTQTISMGLTVSADLQNYLVGHRPDMIILDIGLADSSELKIIDELRHIYDGFLIVLTSKSTEEQHFQMLDLGADDYLLKPIDSRILIKRIEKLFRRQIKNTGHIELASMTVGNICLQPQSQKCFINGKGVKLTTFEFNLLKALVEHHGNILSRDELYNTLLKRAYNGVERTLDVRMSQLREKLTMGGMKDHQIETVWGQGYMLSQINS